MSSQVMVFPDATMPATLLGGLAPHLQVTAGAAKKKPGKTGLFPVLR